MTNIYHDTTQYMLPTHSPRSQFASNIFQRIIILPNYVTMEVTFILRNFLTTHLVFPSFVV